MSWSQAKEARQSMGGGASIFLKLADGEEVQFVVTGSPKAVVKPGFNEGEPPRTRFEANVVMAGSPIGDVKIWDMSPTVFDHLVALNDKGRCADRWLFLKREGMGLDTKYRLIPGDSLTGAAKKAVKGVQLHEIGQGALKVEDVETEGEPEELDVDGMIAKLKEAKSVDDLQNTFRRYWPQVAPTDQPLLKERYHEIEADLRADTQDMPF